MQNIPYHTHNGTDSPYVYSNTYTYIGSISSDGSILILPQGWSVIRASTGIYEIIHNLNTNLYSVSAVAINTNGVPLVNGNDISVGFVIAWTKANTAAALDTDFIFTLTAYTAVPTKPPIYTNNS